MLPSPISSVIFQRVDDGAVLFSPATELYFGLNEVGAKVWQLLPPASADLEEICRRLAEDYPTVEVDVLRADVTELLDQLIAEGLVAPAGPGPSVPPAS